MAKHIKVVGGKLLCQRVGPLRFQKQDMWKRAPERRGLWAFPWPYNEPFLNFHQLSRHMPKRLQYPPLPKVEDTPLASPGLTDDEEETFTLDDLNTFLLENEPTEEELALEAAHENSYEQWIKRNRKKVAPLRKFYWEGSVYSHFNVQGEVIDFDEWCLLTVEQFEKAFKKARGVTYWEARREDGTSGLAPGSNYSCDHLELFLSPRQGRFSGRV